MVHRDRKKNIQKSKLLYLIMLKKYLNFIILKRNPLIFKLLIKKNRQQCSGNLFCHFCCICFYHLFGVYFANADFTNVLMTEISYYNNN